GVCRPHPSADLLARCPPRSGSPCCVTAPSVPCRLPAPWPTPRRRSQRPASTWRRTRHPLCCSCCSAVACSRWAAPPVAAHAAHSPRIVRVGRNPPPEATNSHDSRPPGGVGAGCGARYAGRVTSASASGSAASESAASSSAASESAGHGDASYAAAGVDTAAGDRAVELMKASVARTHGPEVLGGVGGFAGLFDASALTGYRRPLLATSTDGVGT